MDRGSRKLLILYLAIFAALLLLPAIQILCKPFPVTEVNGMSLPSRPARPTWKTLLNESFQKKFEQWFTRGNGLWPWMVRLSNQLYFSGFGQISGGYNGSVLVGKGGFLFQPMYLKAFNRSKSAKRRELEAVVRDLRDVQQLLAARHVPLVFLVSPNAIGLYPELVPSQYRDPTRLMRKNSYDIVRPLLDQYGINYVNSFEYFQRRRDSLGFRVFEPTGSHLNDVGSCQETNLLLSKIEEISTKKFDHFPCEPVVWREPPAGAEIDLLEIANLLWPQTAWQPAPYVESKGRRDRREGRPRILLVGTSFLFAVQHQLEKHHVTSRAPLFFYYRQVRERSGDPFRTLTKARIDWPRDILSYDAIVLQANQASIGAVGYGFLTDALRQLRPERPAEAVPKQPRKKNKKKI